MPDVPEPARAVAAPAHGEMPAAGWYPDPDRSGSLWWTGTGWSDGHADRRAPAPDSTRRPAVAPHPEDSYLAGHTVSTPVNPAARLGLVLGAVAVILNPVLLVGAAALVVSGVGLHRATLMGQHGYPAVGRSRAMGGLALGLLATAASIVLKGGMF